VPGVIGAGVAGTLGMLPTGCPAGTDAAVEAGISIGANPVPPASFYVAFE
jgi:hypothetical protein